jgi:putative ABC transport system permease protein
MTVSVANLVDYQNRVHAFEGLASFDYAPMNLTGIGSPERVAGEAVSWNYFRVLGVEPKIGRTFLPEDERPDARPVVMLTHDFWQRRMGADTKVLERSVTLDGKPRQVVGVMPEHFESPYRLAAAQQTEFFVPTAYPNTLFASHGDHEVNVLGRLKPRAGRPRRN